MKRTLLAVCLAACGNDDVHHLSDSGTDSPAPTPDASSSAVTVTVTQFGMPVSGQAVYFQNADSTVVASAATDANGKASAVMAPGGFVTVLAPQRPSAINNQVVDTFTGVEPGDDLHVDVGNASPGVTITFNLTVPTDPDPNAVDYALFTSCGGADITPPLALRRGFAATTNPPVQVSLTDCNGAADMLVVTSDGNGIERNSFFVPAQAVADAQDVTLDATYAPLVAQRFDYTNLPASVVDVSLAESMITARGSVYDNSNGDAAPLAGSASIPHTFPDTMDATQVAVHSFAPDASIVSAQTITDWGVPNAGTSIDYGAIKLGDYTTPPAFDFTTKKVGWTITSGATPDLTVAAVIAQRTDGAGATSSWLWEVIAPGTSDGAVELPTVPTDVFDFNLQPTDSLQVFVGSATFPGGYDAVRPHAFAFDPVTAAVGGGTGHIVAEQFQPSTPTLRHAIWHGAPARRVFQRR